MFQKNLKNRLGKDHQSHLLQTEHDVLRALGKEHCDVDDFMALISPAAAKYLEPMAQLSKDIPKNVSAKPFPCLYRCI